MGPKRAPANDELPPEPPSSVEDKFKDGLNFYRSVSRWEYGNPDQYEAIKEGLLLKYLTVHVCREHALHEDFKALQHSFRHTGQTPDPCLTWALEYPDVFPSPELYKVIAKLLEIRLDVTHNSLTTTYGHQDLAPYSITIHEFQDEMFQNGGYEDQESLSRGGRNAMHFSSIPAIDREGHALLSLIHETRQVPLQAPSGVDIRRAGWRWKNRIDSEGSTDYSSITCVDNENRVVDIGRNSSDGTAAPPSPLDHSFQVFTVCVSRPQQIKSAVDYMLECLKRAPCQGLPGLFDPTGPGKKILKPFMGVDAEFVKRKAETIDGHPCFREYVSVLSFAIDRHAVFMFHVLDMLENANDETVTALHYLYRKTIFDASILKVWHNYQSDIPVVESTIRLMHGEDIPPKFCDISRPMADEVDIKRDNQYFKTKRPDWLRFPTVDKGCLMHDNVNKSLICPCSLGNIELASLYGFIVRDLDLRRTPRKAWSWDAVRDCYNYADLLAWVLIGHPLYPILDHLKNVSGGPQEKHDFYQSMMPGMEADDRKLGYNVGDVVGIAIMFKALVAPMSRDLLALQLLRQDQKAFIHASEIEELAGNDEDRCHENVRFLNAKRRSSFDRASRLARDTLPEKEALVRALKLATPRTITAGPNTECNVSDEIPQECSQEDQDVNGFQTWEEAYHPTADQRSRQRGTHKSWEATRDEAWDIFAAQAVNNSWDDDGYDNEPSEDDSKPSEDDSKPSEDDEKSKILSSPTNGATDAVGEAVHALVNHLCNSGRTEGLISNDVHAIYMTIVKGDDDKPEEDYKQRWRDVCYKAWLKYCEKSRRRLLEDQVWAQVEYETFDATRFRFPKICFVQQPASDKRPEWDLIIPAGSSYAEELVRYIAAHREGPPPTGFMSKDVPFFGCERAPGASLPNAGQLLDAYKAEYAFPLRDYFGFNCPTVETTSLFDFRKGLESKRRRWSYFDSLSSLAERLHHKRKDRPLNQYLDTEGKRYRNAVKAAPSWRHSKPFEHSDVRNSLRSIRKTIMEHVLEDSSAIRSEWLSQLPDSDPMSPGYGIYCLKWGIDPYPMDEIRSRCKSLGLDLFGLEDTHARTEWIVPRHGRGGFRGETENQWVFESTCCIQ